MAFDVQNFLPYLLNRAAEEASIGFQEVYKSEYGMLRTEWRVLFHLGQYGDMTANEICKRGALHKTKVSRAVSALEAKRFLNRMRQAEDKRFETLSLTSKGEEAYRRLEKKAEQFHGKLTVGFTEDEIDFLLNALKKLTRT